MVARLARALAAVALLCAAAGGWAAPGGHEGHGGKAPRPELGASAALDPQGGLWAVHKQGGELLLRRALDQGAWTEGRRVAPPGEGVAADGDARPKLAFGPRGEIFVSWTRPLSRPYTGEIRFTRSLDGGESFEAPRTVHQDRQEITHRFDALVVNARGQVIVAWIDKRDLEAAKAGGGDYRGAAVYFAVSDDAGASFRGDYRAAEHSCECCRIGLAPQPDGSVDALWRHVFEPNVRDHALTRLHPDGHADTPRRATFDDWRVDACPHHGPSLAVDPQGRLHAVWYNQAEGASGVSYGRLVEGGVEGRRRLGGPAAAHADLAVSGRRVALAWKEFDGSATRLLASLSEDGGESWRDLDLGASAGPSDQPRLLARDGGFLLFWNTAAESLSVRALP